MFRWIIGSSLQFRFLVVGVAAALVAFGAVGLRNMPVDVFPEFAAPVVEVQTEAIGLSAKEVESLIKPKLLGVPGVANVAIWGQRLRQLHVHIDPDRLRDSRLMQDDIISAAGDAFWVTPLTFLKGSAPVTGGWIDNRNQRLGVYHGMPITTPEDMAKVAVGAQHLLMTGKTMSLGEIAEVTFAHPPLIGDAFVNNGNGLLLVVDKFPSANTLEVTRGVEAALAELRRGLPGVDIDPGVFRLASYIEDSFANLARAILFGAVLVVLVIGAFLFDWRSALISVVSI